MKGDNADKSGLFSWNKCVRAKMGTPLRLLQVKCKSPVLLPLLCSSSSFPELPTSLWISPTCKQVFVPLWIASITPAPFSNGVSEKREGKRRISCLKSPSRAAAFSLYQNTSCRKGSQRQKTAWAINKSCKGVSLAVLFVCCSLSSYLLQLLLMDALPFCICITLLSLFISMETLFCHAVYREWD